MDILNETVNFELKNQADKLVKLSDFLGKNVVVYFYPKDDTPGCTKEAQGFSELKDQFLALNTVIIGISKDSVKKHQSFCSKHDLNITLLSDPDIIVQKQFDVWKEKSMYGRTYFGTQRSTFVINQTGSIVKSWRNVKVPGHVETVLDFVKTLT